MANKSSLILQLRDKTLQLSLEQGAWAVWRVATYPLAILTGYMFFGQNGAITVAVLLILSYRGKL